MVLRQYGLEMKPTLSLNSKVMKIMRLFKSFMNNLVHNLALSLISVMVIRLKPGKVYL